MIIKNKKELTKKCEPCESIEEGEAIGAQLLKELTDAKNGIGLAANQIGINKRVCVINVKEPIVLINPRIIDKSKEMFAFQEGCLSFPNESIVTSRHKRVMVEADNHSGKLFFDYSPPSHKPKDLSSAFETVCVQHEIDHLDGITMYDREIKKPKQITNTKIGRNEKVTVTKGSESKVLKYKKAIPLLEDGWTLSMQSKN